MTTARDWLWPAAASAVFLVLYLPAARLIGIDDGHVAWVSWRLSRLQAFPLMFTLRHGPGDFYLTAPFLRLFGATVFAMAARQAFLGALAVTATYALALALLESRAAAAAAGLVLACAPTFVRHALIGCDAALSAAALATAALALLAWGVRRRRPGLLFGGFFLLGAALSCRTWTIALFPGLAAFAWRRRKEAAARFGRPRRQRRLAAASLFFFMIPLIPWAAGLAGHAAAVRSYWISRFQQPDFGAPNTAYAANFLGRLGQLRELASGTADLWLLSATPGAHAVPAWPIGLALGASVASAFVAKRHGRRATTLFVALACAGYLALAPFTPTLRQPWHLLPLAPLLCVLACAPLAESSGAWRAFAAVFVAWSVGSGARATAGLRDELARTGGESPILSRAADDLCRWAIQRPGTRFVVLGEGPDETLLFESRGAARVERVGVDPELGVQPRLESPSFNARWDELIDDKSAVFVSDLPDSELRLPDLLLRRRLARRRLKAIELATFNRPDGRPVWAVFEVARR